MLGDNVWESFVEIKSCGTCHAQQDVLKTLSDEIVPVVSNLELSKIVRMYCFLIHDRKSGVPTKKKGAFVHIRFWLEKGVMPSQLKKNLTKSFTMTRKVNESKLREINGLDMSKLQVKSDSAWILISNQSRWVVSMIVHHKQLPSRQHRRQFLHYLSNMVQECVS